MAAVFLFFTWANPLLPGALKILLSKGGLVGRLFLFVKKYFALFRPFPCQEFSVQNISVKIYLDKCVFEAVMLTNTA